jgi:hypothetical protein
MKSDHLSAVIGLSDKIYSIFTEVEPNFCLAAGMLSLVLIHPMPKTHNAETSPYSDGFIHCLRFRNGSVEHRSQSRTSGGLGIDEQCPFDWKELQERMAETICA